MRHIHRMPTKATPTNKVEASMFEGELHKGKLKNCQLEILK